MSSARALIKEMDKSARLAAAEERCTAMRQLTDLFASGAESFTIEHIELFDELMCHLLDTCDDRTLAYISETLAPLHNAPFTVTRLLARRDEIKLSGPFLQKSNFLAEHELADLASTKSQAHLAAIATRSAVAPAVTDILIQRGNPDVAKNLAANAGAAFSKDGYKKLVHLALFDEQIADKIAHRDDMPHELLFELFTCATESVRKSLMNHSNPVVQERMKQFPLAAAGSAQQNAGEHPKK